MDFALQLKFAVLFWVIPLGLSVAAGYALCELKYQLQERELEREEEFANALLRAEASQRLRKSREEVVV